MQITTKENIKQLIGKSDAGDDAILQAIAVSVSARCEKYMERLVEQVARTQYFDIEDGQTRFNLSAWPVSACSVWNDEDRSWATELDAAVFTVLGNSGVLVIDDYSLVSGAMKLKVTYTGGLAASQAALQSAYPDLEMAARIQGAFVYDKRQKLGVAAEAMQGSTIRFEEKLKLLPDVQATLDTYARHVYAV